MGEESDPPLKLAEAAEPEEVAAPVIEKTVKFSRCRKPSLSVSDRIRGFDEVVSVFSEDMATTEALRCLHCHLGAKLNQEKCVSCLTCVRVCPLEIPRANKMGEITIDPVDCQACGMCVIECPVRAIDMSLHSPQETLQEIEQAMSPSPQASPVIVGFFDLHGSFTEADLERFRTDYPNVIPLTVFGLRRISAPDVLKAFELGADAVLLAPCPHERDPFPDTRDKVKGRMALVSAVVEALGLGGDRLEICDMPEKGLVDEKNLDEFIEKIKEMGPSPLRV